jgi:hypothetical protein
LRSSSAGTATTTAFNSRERFWKILFASLALARFLSLIPFIVDDDEAWWSVAARSLSSPFEYYFRAVDHKPPGIVWFVKFFGSDPRLSRFFFTLLIAMVAILLGRIRRKKIDWKASCFFLFALAVGSPKLLTLTADGVLVFFIVAAYFVALSFDFRWSSVLAGALLGCALLVKQTGVFFAIPILFAREPKKWSIREIFGFALGSAFIYVPAVFLMDWREFFYWNWTYPREVLTRARGSAFNLFFDMATNALQYLVVLLPLFYFALHAKVHDWKRDFRILWLIAALMGTFLGRGIFLHYFLLLAPPLALLAADGFSEKRFALAWLISGYAFACLVITFPFSGLFWGNDSLHAELVARKMDQIGELLHDRSVMVWGGSSLPLAYSSANYSGRFLLPRFAEPPYQTDRTLEIFHREFEEHPPMLIVDLHERGDNLFDNPFESDPFILVHLESGYHLFIDPTLPWAKFYVRNPSVGLAALHLEAITGLENTQRVYSKFPTRESEWRFLGEDREHRVSDALELLSLQSQDPVVRNRAGELLREFKLSEAEAFLVTFKEPLLPLRSRLWWPEVAIVELQPKLFSGKK